MENPGTSCRGSGANDIWNWFFIILSALISLFIYTLTFEDFYLRFFNNTFDKAVFVYNEASGVIFQIFFHL